MRSEDQREMQEALRSASPSTRAEALQAALDAALPAHEVAALVEVAAEDPHWRVRRGLLEGLRGPARAEVAAALAARLREAPGRTPRRAGVLRYLLRHVLGVGDGELPADVPVLDAYAGLRRTALWDDDPAVLRERVRGPLGRAHRALLPVLLTHEDEGVRRAALKQLRLGGEAPELLRCLELLEDPRTPFADEVVTRLVGYLNPDRLEELRAVAPAGALERCLRPAPARELTPLAAARAAPAVEPPLALPAAQEGAARRALGRSGLVVSPLGISGHYGLPVPGYAAAFEAGVNLFFWEPPYTAQTRFFQRLGVADRERLVVVCGTFEAEPRAIRRDVERSLRSLGLSRVPLFLLFWARSAARLESLQTLRALQGEGLVQCYGVSTHLRPLARRALELGVPVVMTRHSAAHRGIEEDLLPEVEKRQAGLITFSNLCYGRMLRERARAAPAPADCYRYSLSQPGVCASLSAPRDEAQLRENLAALRDPWLPQPQQEELRRYGALVYQDNRDFMDWVRSR